MPDYSGFQDAARAMGEELATLIKPDPAGTILKPQQYLGDYLTEVFGLKPALHHTIWIDKLEDEQNYPRLLFVCPPGHAKTTVAGVGYPSWKLGNHPSRHFLYLGNTSTQAKKQSMAIRDLVLSEPYQRVFPHIRRSRSKSWAEDMWYLERPEAWDKDPSMLAMGVDGPALGARADEFLFDDVNDPQNTATEAQRNKVTAIVKAVAFTRQTGKSKFVRMVAVMTRWHDEDLVKTFEEEGFEVVWMPALGYWEYVHNRPLPEGKPRFLLTEVDELMGDDLAKLEEGSPLWPAEYDRDYFEPFQKNSPDIFLLQFQGLSIRPGGNRFKEEDFRYWGPGTDVQLDPYKVRGVFQFWDTASKAKTQHDWWVCQTWAWCTDGFYLLDVYANKMEFPAGQAAVEAKWRAGAQLPAIEGNELVQLTVRMVLVEETGTNNGTAVVQTLLLKRVPITGIPKSMSKEEAVDMALGPFRDKPFYFPLDGARYTGLSREDVIRQHLQFPRGRHDDAVDVTAEAVNYLNTFQVKPGADWKGSGQVNEQLRMGSRPRPSIVPSGISNKLVRGGFGSRAGKLGRGQRDPAIPD